MIDGRKHEVRSIEELIEALHPVESLALGSDDFEASLMELRLMKSNISAVLSFTRYSLGKGQAEDAELHALLDDVRSRCLGINAMISRAIFRQRWLFKVSKLEESCEILRNYREMAEAARCLCLRLSPESGNQLRHAF